MRRELSAGQPCLQVCRASPTAGQEEDSLEVVQSMAPIVQLAKASLALTLYTPSYHASSLPDLKPVAPAPGKEGARGGGGVADQRPKPFLVIRVY